jgi:hypothetical protein
MFNCLPRDCDVVIWAYTVETLSLREALPEKQSVKRGVATWASALENKRERKRKRSGGDMGGRKRAGHPTLWL